MGIWDAITEGRMPTLEDAAATRDSAVQTVAAAGTAVTDTAGALADGAVSMGRTAVGYGERAVDAVGGAARAGGQMISDGADAAWHGLTDWHFEGRDAHNGPAPSAADLNGNGWVRQPEWMAALHQDPDHAGSEVKYVNADGRESIRYANPDGSDAGEVTDDRYRGTYNYVNPGVWDDLRNQGVVAGVPVGGAAEWAARGVGHFAADILPWYLGGTVRGPG